MEKRGNIVGVQQDGVGDGPPQKGILRAAANPSDTPNVAREFRLHWRETPSGPEATLAHGPVDAWVGSQDPMAIKAFVRDQGWPPEMELRVAIVDAGAPMVMLSTIACVPAQVADWSPEARELPEGEPVKAPPPTRSAAKLMLLRDLRVAMNAATRAGALSRDDADGLLLLVRDVVERDRR